MSFHELRFTNDEEQMVKFLQQNQLFWSNLKCDKKQNCGDMKLSSRNHRGQKMVQWRCSKCGAQQSVRKDSFLESSKLKIIVAVKIIIEWALMTSYVNMAKALNVSRQVCADFCHRLRYLVSLDFDRDSIKLGGEGIMIEIDESLFAKVIFKDTFKFNVSFKKQ